MKFKDIIKYLVNYNFVLRIIKGNFEYIISFDWDLKGLKKYFDLSLKSLVVNNNNLVISLVDESEDYVIN